MSIRSRLWWTAAFVLPLGSVLYQWTLPYEGYAFAGPVCRWHEVHAGFIAATGAFFTGDPLLWWAGLPGVALACAAHWAAGRAGRPHWGRAAVRVVAVLLLARMITPLAFALSLAEDRSCLDAWGGLAFAPILVAPDTAAALAGVCLLLAVHRSRGRSARLRRAVSSGIDRVAPVAVPLILLAVVPAADLVQGRPGREGCRAAAAQSGRFTQDEVDFLCTVRQTVTDPVARTADHHLLAYGRQVCASYTAGRLRPGRTAPDGLPAAGGFPAGFAESVVAPLCPPLRREPAAAQAAVEREYRAEEEWAKRRCRATRHRPRIAPLAVHHELVYPEYGVLEAYEVAKGEDLPLGDDDLLDRLHRGNGLIAAEPRHLMVRVPGDLWSCLTVEIHRRRPPLETAGWDRVAEVGYRSALGRLHLYEGFAPGDGRPLLDLVPGKGRYRIRVHHRNGSWEHGREPGRLLITVYPAPRDRSAGPRGG